MHGLGSHIVARVEVRYKGKSLSDGMKYSMLTDWVVGREASNWHY